MQKRRLLANATMSMLQVIVVGGTLFVLYKFLLKTIGVEELGIWSLVLATTSITQIANFGLSGSTVKFVARYLAREEHENVSDVIQTATISIAVIMGIFLFVGYPIAQWILELVIPAESFDLAVQILPFSFFALWIMVIASVFNAGLDGFQRIYIRNLIFMGGTIIFLILCYYFARSHGLVGLAYAQIIQNSIILVVSWMFLRRFAGFLPIIPYKWNKRLFKEIIGYGTNFQIISVTIMFYDPITKSLLSKFGGLSMVGYYEMANRMVQQFRALIVSANQVLVPAIADLQERTPEKIRTVYSTSYQLIFYLSLPIYTLLVVSAPFISEMWIGKYESTFVIFAALLSIGWFLNTLGVPAYFANLGIGDLRWNVVSHIIIAMLNAAVGAVLGTFFDGIGVIAGWTISLALGSSLIYLSYHWKHDLPLNELLPRASRVLFLICIGFVMLSSIIISGQTSLNMKANIVYLIIIAFLLTVSLPFWLHPMRKQLLAWVSNELIKRPSI